MTILEFARHVYVRDERTKALGPISLYPVQRRFLSRLFGTVDDEGRRVYRRAVYSVPKKGGKSTLGALVGLFMLCCDEAEPDREIYSIATDLDQARLIFQAAVRMVERSPTLRQWVEAGYLRQYRDALELSWGDARGVFRPLATDTKGTHGVSPSCLLCDESWTQQDYGLLEACALPPTRVCPLELHVSYAGLVSQQRPGSPLWDLFETARRGTDRSLLFEYRHGPDAWRHVPWITQSYMDAQRRALPANRYQRLHLNEWGQGDTPFVTSEEIDAVFDGSVPYAGADILHPWVLAVDYGRSHDMTAVCVARTRDDGTVEIGELIVLRGTRANPVPLELVEQTIIACRQKFRLVQATADAWQMHGSIERLSRRMRITPVTFGPAYLNRITMNVLSLIRSGRLKCFEHADFRTQLGSVVARETFYGTRIDSGQGAGVRSHDDIVIAVAMAAQLAIERGHDTTLVTLAGVPESRPRSDAGTSLRAQRRERMRAALVELGLPIPPERGVQL